MNEPHYLCRSEYFESLLFCTVGSSVYYSMLSFARCMTCCTRSTRGPRRSNALRVSSHLDPTYFSLEISFAVSTPEIPRAVTKTTRNRFYRQQCIIELSIDRTARYKCALWLPYMNGNHEPARFPELQVEGVPFCHSSTEHRLGVTRSTSTITYVYDECALIFRNRLDTPRANKYHI